MKRIGFVVAGVLAALVPAVGGMWGNATFSRAVPVRVPSSAEVVTPAATPAPPSASTPSARHGTREPGDDHGGATPRVQRSEPGDDHGGATRAPSTSASSTSGGHGSDDTAPDDHGGRGGDD